MRCTVPTLREPVCRFLDDEEEPGWNCSPGSGSGQPTNAQESAALCHDRLGGWQAIYGPRQIVSYTPSGHDVPGTMGVAFELLAKVMHTLTEPYRRRMYGPGSPDAATQILAGHDAAVALNETRQQAVLGRRQPNLLAPQDDGFRGAVDDEFATVRPRAPVSSQAGLDSCADLRPSVRPAQAIISAQIEGPHESPRNAPNPAPVRERPRHRARERTQLRRDAGCLDSHRRRYPGYRHRPSGTDLQVQFRVKEKQSTSWRACRRLSLTESR